MSLIAVFASLHATLYLVSFGFGGLWRNWGVYLEAIEGIVLGPVVGALSAFMGAGIGRAFTLDPTWMFGLVAEPFAAFAAGLLVRSNWKPVLAACIVMISAFFVDPVGRSLPLWTVLDVVLATVLIFPASRLGRSLLKPSPKSATMAAALVFFVSIATDSLVRVFILVPCKTYTWLVGSLDALHGLFIVSAAYSYTEDLLSIVISLIIGVPLLLAVSRLGLFSENEKKR